jgi:hypothetical protein
MRDGESEEAFLSIRTSAPGGEGNTLRPSRRVRTIAIFAVLLSTASLVAGMVVARGQAGYFVYEDGTTLVQDFASHLTFTRGVWRGEVAEVETGSMYSVAAHLRIMSEWMGEGTTRALPFGYSPTMLWLLLPLCFLPIPLAYVLWTLAGAGAAGWMISKARFHWILGLTVFLTPIVVGALALGQTAVLGTVGIFFLADRTLANSPHQGTGSVRSGLSLIVVLWALSAKPPLAVTAGVAMLALGMIRPVVLATALTVVTAAVATPWLGSGWVADYASLVGHYDRVGADPAFGWSFWPEHMSNLRAFLSVDLGVGDDAASVLSNLAWLCSLGMIMLAGWLRWLRPPLVWGFAILAYLLFCAHLTSTEELLLLLVPAVAAPWGDRRGGGWAYLPWIAVPVALLLSPVLGPASGLRPSLLWIVELGLAGWLVAQLPGSRRQLRREAAGLPYGQG